MSKSNAEKITTRRSYTQCELCEKKFKDHIMYELHKINDHIINLTENSPTKPDRHLLKALQNPYKCNFCDLTFPQTELLNVHIKKHFREICGGATDPDGAGSNMEIEKNERNFVCNVCGKSFLRKVHLMQHSRAHSGERPFKCTTCGNRYKYSCNLQIHERVHTGIKIYQCKYCEKAFDYKTNVIQHERVHTGEKPYVCDVCNKGFTQKFSMLRHRNICGTNKAARLRSKINDGSDMQNSHSEFYNFVPSGDDTSEEKEGFRGFDLSQIIAGKNSDISSCEPVEDKYLELNDDDSNSNQENIEYCAQKSEYQETIAAVESLNTDLDQNKNEATYYNPLQDHQYSNQIITYIKIEKVQSEEITPVGLIKTELVANESENYDSNDIMFNEEIIIPYYEESIDNNNKSPGKRKSREYEELIVVDDPVERPAPVKSQNLYACPNIQITSELSNTYESNYNFEAITRKKVKKNQYKCDVCHVTIEDKNHFREHKLIHENKPFKCSYCPKSFIRNHDLQSHERIHTGENPYKCNYCSKTFDYKTNFIQHERIHTGVKPFKCGYCEKAFTQKASMLRHQNIHIK